MAYVKKSFVVFYLCHYTFSSITKLVSVSDVHYTTLTVEYRVNSIYLFFYMDKKKSSRSQYHMRMSDNFFKAFSEAVCVLKGKQIFVHQVMCIISVAHIRGCTKMYYCLCVSIVQRFLFILCNIQLNKIQLVYTKICLYIIELMNNASKKLNILTFMDGKRCICDFSCVMLIHI